jgi:dTDP-4-amino-4,6-dideoxygalactose transaminase
LTEIQAAIGRIQLRKLPLWIIQRRRNAAILTACFSDIPALRVTVPADNTGHSYYKYYTFLKTSLLKKDWNRDRIMNAIEAEGIPCFSGSCSEIYLEKAFDKKDFRPIKRLPIAKELGETSLMFCVHPTLSKQNLLDTCNAVKKVITKASRV